MWLGPEFTYVDQTLKLSQVSSPKMEEYWLTVSKLSLFLQNSDKSDTKFWPIFNTYIFNSRYRLYVYLILLTRVKYATKDLNQFSYTFL